MPAMSLDAASIDGFCLRQGLSWRDPDIDCTLVISQPSTDRGLWTEYAAGAQRSYRKHGVACALDVDALRTGADTVMFCVVSDRAGKIVAGVRAKGPLRSADDSHAVVEWAGQPGQAAVRSMINDRVKRKNGREAPRRRKLSARAVLVAFSFWKDRGRAT